MRRVYHREYVVACADCCRRHGWRFPTGVLAEPIGICSCCDAVAAAVARMWIHRIEAVEGRQDLNEETRIYPPFGGSVGEFYLWAGESFLMSRLPVVTRWDKEESELERLAMVADRD